MVDPICDMVEYKIPSHVVKAQNAGNKADFRIYLTGVNDDNGSYPQVQQKIILLNTC